MSNESDRSGGRNLKRLTLDILRAQDRNNCAERILSLPERQVINALISLMLHPDQMVRWRSIMAIGEVVNQLANKDMEAARVIMRRFMWTLNDESGGIGWGAPEAMCACIGGNEKIASEFGHIVVSYLDREGNFLEYEPLQRGLLWGVSYLAQKRPKIVAEAGPHLVGYLDSEDAHVRGLTVMALKSLGVKESVGKLRDLVSDENLFSTYQEDQIKTFSVGEKACDAVKSMGTI